MVAVELDADVTGAGVQGDDLSGRHRRLLRAGRGGSINPATLGRHRAGDCRRDADRLRS
jgi:hypothetical protein